jgi:mono/diheme cytochrome c family protein
MRRFTRLAFLIAFAGLLASPARAQTSAGGGDVQAGQRLAADVCSNCHMVSLAQAAQPKLRPPAPSFIAIANRPGVTAASLRAFLLTTHKTMRTPPNMPSMLLSDDEAASAAAYILSLRTQP